MTSTTEVIGSSIHSTYYSIIPTYVLDEFILWTTMSNDLEPIDSSRQLLSQHVIQQQDQDRAQFKVS